MSTIACPAEFTGNADRIGDARTSLGAFSPLAVSVLLGLVAVVYWPVLQFEFVHWDDPWYVLKNPLITSWHPQNLWRIVSEMSVKNYAPLTTLSLLIDHTLFGFEPGGYHLTNVLLHAANTLLVFWLVTRLSDSQAIGLTTAALFAIHPVQIETVAWVSSRKSLLCALFMLASGLCWLKRERTSKDEMWGTIWLALSLLAKASSIIVPPIVLTYDMLVRRKSLAEAVPRQIVPSFLCVIFLNITMSAQTTEMGGVRDHLALSKLQLLGVDAVILWKYVAMLAWPTELSVLYDPPTRGILVPVAISLLAWIAVACLCWQVRSRSPLAVWAVITWFWLLFPVLNFFPITTLMNDRYLYLPSVCAFALFTGAVTRGMERLLPSTAATLCSSATVALAVVLSAVLSLAHLPVWRNDYALWSHTIAHVPDLPVVQIQWADTLQRAGRTEEAVAVLRGTLADERADAPDRQRILRRLSNWE